jgi:GntR family transcriptional regulator
LTKSYRHDYLHGTLAGKRPPNGGRRRAAPEPRRPDAVERATTRAGGADKPLPPLYYRVYRTLEQRIRDQQYRFAERLPSEDELCRLFGASRITIREAVGRLVDQGLVIRRRGSGSYVSFRADGGKATAPLKFTAVLEDLFAEVQTVRTRSAEIVEELPPSDIRATLRLRDNEPVTVVRRVRAFRDQVFSLTHNYLPRHLGAHLTEAELYRFPLLRLLEEKLKVVSRYADQTVEARAADEDVAKALEIQFGDPVLFVERRMFADTDQPFEVVRSFYRADVYRYHIRLTRSRKAPFRWRLGERE